MRRAAKRFDVGCASQSVAGRAAPSATGADTGDRAIDQQSVFVALGTALGVGLLIGFEREQSVGAEQGGGSSMGGVRTYPLVSLGGALATLLAREVGAWFVALAFVVVGAFVAISYADDVRERHEHGFTSAVAMLLAFVLGALAAAESAVSPARDRVIVLFSVAVVVTLVLSLKTALHALAHRATKDDVYATLKFLLVAVVLLPLLPDKTIGPLDVFNPFRTGLLIVLIAGVGFAGYVAVRVLGPGRGLGLTGLVGGLVSSTAVTLAAAGRARREPELRPACSLAVVLANAVMTPRVAVIVAVVDPDLLAVIGIPFAALVAVGAAASFVFWRGARGARGESGELRVANPFELSAAVKMGLLVAALLFATKAAVLHLGVGGVYATSALAGLADVDAISVSMAHLALGQIDAVVAATAILLAVAANTAAKTVIAYVVGGRQFGRAVLPTSVATLLTVAAGIVWLRR